MTNVITPDMGGYYLFSLAIFFVFFILIDGIFLIFIGHLFIFIPGINVDFHFVACVNFVIDIVGFACGSDATFHDCPFLL